MKASTLFLWIGSLGFVCVGTYAIAGTVAQVRYVTAAQNCPSPMSELDRAELIRLRAQRTPILPRVYNVCFDGEQIDRVCMDKVAKIVYGAHKK